MSAISEGKSMFITGSAGTGKTILVKHINKQLKKCHAPSKVFVTAPTGVAACAISGQTLHSFAGTGCARDTVLHRISNDNNAYKRWWEVEALVLDEISLIDAESFESLDFIARAIKQVHEVWGGIQLLVSGDFFQLPPVKPKGAQFYNKFTSEQDKEGEDDNISQNKNGSNDNGSEEIDGRKYVRVYLK